MKVDVICWIVKVILIISIAIGGIGLIIPIPEPLVVIAVVGILITVIANLYVSILELKFTRNFAKELEELIDEENEGIN